MAIFNLSAEAFNIPQIMGQTLLGGTGQSSADASRIPMVFTSTKRLRFINDGIGRFSDLQFGEDLLAAKNFTEGELPTIQMMVNPNSIAWRQPKRITKRDTQEGSIYFHFTNARGQNNDILTADFRGNTGNIDLTGDISVNQAAQGALGATGESNQALQKLNIWHNLWKLSREAVLLEDNVINEFLITYTSRAIPLEIMLIGFFSSTLEWEDNAEKPNSKDYTFSFTVQEIIPDIDDIVKEISTTFIKQ